VVLRAVLVSGLLIGTLGCGEAVTPVAVPLAPAPAGGGPDVANRPVNINELVVQTTMVSSGLVAPYRVIGIRLGVLGDLQGIDMADRAAVAAWQGTATTDLDLTAWKVELVGSQSSTACGSGACGDRFAYVEAYLTDNGRAILGITMHSLPPGDPRVPPGG
jgi:hypothetical protein